MSALWNGDDEMKSLDELLLSYELCKSSNAMDCTKCPYYDDDREIGCRSDDKDDDSFYYLKEYKQKTKDFEDILTDYVALKQYWAEQQENPPLTWSELSQMRGKPAWVEWYNGSWKGKGIWVIIGNIKENVMSFTASDIASYAYNGQLYRIQIDDIWKAYRKEMIHEEVG